MEADQTDSERTSTESNIKQQSGGGVPRREANNYVPIYTAGPLYSIVVVLAYIASCCPLPKSRYHCRHESGQYCILYPSKSMWTHTEAARNGIFATNAHPCILVTSPPPEPV